MCCFAQSLTWSLLCHLLVSRSVGQDLPQLDAYRRLREDLLGRPAAVHKTPPWLGRGSTTGEMSILAVPIDTLNVDELDQFTWRQPALSWNETEYDNLEIVYVETGSVWSPQIMAVVGTGDSLHVELPETLELQRDGQLTARRHYQLTFRCKIDFQRYPFDTQVCRLGFNVMARGGLGMNLTLTTETVDLSRFYDVSGEWTLVGFGLTTVSAFVKSFSASYPVAVFTLKRRPVYYVITIVFPLVMTSLMIPLVFLIPSGTGEKISYLVAIFTSTAIFLNFICNVMPRGLLSVPYLAVLLIEVLVEGWLATLASLFVVRKYCQEEKQSEDGRKDSFLKHLISKSGQVSPASMSTDHRKLNCEAKDGVSRSQNLADRATTPSPNVEVRWSSGQLGSARLDQILFVSLSVTQVSFLLVLFCTVDWL